MDILEVSSSMLDGYLWKGQNRRYFEWSLELVLKFISNYLPN